ncbi:MaoC/PaaZ C-terminal domain-containing protein [Rhizohabitans arisaemae]|uniref:MaoC/PaaZ C-terminal domain-containing protein n=1 Tax=Rhizohabitans arisaemae TaxID=2720610 RepID=UPI0024B1112B|nr:MaoC/PaaZ C-terminal domain-containing protein [Rhizohabitans arisaemae]
MKLEIPTITRTTLALYAGASGDHNPMHIDLDVARSAGLPDVFAHGMLSMAYLGRLLTDLVDQGRIRTYAVRFTAVTPVHAKPVCTAVVTKVENGLTYLDLTVTTEEGTQTLTGQAIIEGEL